VSGDRVLLEFVRDNVWPKCDDVRRDGQRDPCRVWSGMVNNSRGLPMVKYRGRRVSAGRIVFEAYRDPLLPTDRVFSVCGAKRCLSPYHLGLISAEEWGEYMRHRVRRGEAHPLSTIPESVVLFIRDSTATTKYLADKFGICKWTVLGIRTYKKRCPLNKEPMRWDHENRKRLPLRSDAIGAD